MLFKSLQPAAKHLLNANKFPAAIHGQRCALAPIAAMSLSRRPYHHQTSLMPAELQELRETVRQFAGNRKTQLNFQ